MTSEGPSTVPRMGSFQRVFLGYRRPEVDKALAARDKRIYELNMELAEKADLEIELTSLSGMVIDREREIRMLTEQLHEVNARHDRSIACLDAVTARLEEVEVQARGQATRIRMKALREAVEVGRRAQDVSEAESAERAEIANVSAEPHEPHELYEGPIEVEVGPLGDYAQLVGLEDAIGQLGASEISIERFSEGRATLSMQLDEPVDLLRELEEHAPLEFYVRRTSDNGLLLDEEQGPGHQAA